MTVDRMTGASDSPPLLDGYEQPREYPRGRVSILLTGVVVTVVAGAIGYDHLIPLGRAITQQAVASSGIWIVTLVGFVLITLTVKLQVEIHEWTHYAVRCLHGKDPEFDSMGILTRGNPNVQIPGQWATRGENIITLVAPLVVVNAIATTLVVWDISPILTFLAALVFLVNTGGAGSDILGAYDDYRYPPGTKIYYPEDGPSSGLIYLPSDSQG